MAWKPLKGGAGKPAEPAGADEPPRGWFRPRPWHLLVIGASVLAAWVLVGIAMWTARAMRQLGNADNSSAYASALITLWVVAIPVAMLAHLLWRYLRDSGE